MSGGYAPLLLEQDPEPMVEPTETPAPLVEPPPVALKIALLGSAPSSVKLAPFTDPSWKIWACSPGAYPVIPTHFGKRLDAWFELHRWEPPVIGDADKQVPWFSPEYCAWMAKLECPVYMVDHTDDVPNSQAYPVEEMLERFGPYFFTSSLSWMFASALVAGATEIGLWGVDMSATEEYLQQRAGCHHFITLAKLMGIKVSVPPESDLLLPPMLYGVGESAEKNIKWRARMKELTTRRDAAQARANAAQQEALFVSGAIDDMQYHLNTWMT